MDVNKMNILDFSKMDDKELKDAELFLEKEIKSKVMHMMEIPEGEVDDLYRKLKEVHKELDKRGLE